MENSKHCEICDLHLFTIKQGIICSLTKEKANFSHKCPDIKLDRNLKENIIKVNKEFDDSKYVKKLASGNMIFYGLIGIAILYFCYYLSVELLEYGIYSTASIVIFVIGISVVGMGIGALNYSRQKGNIISPKKEILDKLTKIYNIKYQFESKISTDLMGIKETKIKLRLHGETFEKTERY